MICCIQIVNYVRSIYEFVYFMPSTIMFRNEDDYKTSVKVCWFNFRKIAGIKCTLYFSKDITFRVILITL